MFTQYRPNKIMSSLQLSMIFNEIVLDCFNPARASHVLNALEEHKWLRDLLDRQAYCGETPLTAAAKSGNARVINRLLQYKVSLTLTNDKGQGFIECLQKAGLDEEEWHLIKRVLRESYTGGMSDYEICLEHIISNCVRRNIIPR